MAGSSSSWMRALLPLGLAALLGCKKDPPPAPAPAAFDPLTLIPTSARTVGGVDLAGVQATALWRRAEARIRREGKPTTDALVACQLDFDRWRRLSLGIGSASDADAVVVVIEAEGIGKAQTLTCLAKQLAAAEGKAPWTAQEEGKVLAGEDGRVGYVVGDDVVVVAEAGWADEVAALVKTPGPSAATGTAAAAFGRTDPSKHVWFAGMLPEQAQAMVATMGGMGEPQDVAGWLDLSAGFEIFLAIGFVDAQAAAAAKEAGEKAWAGAEVMAREAGLPQAMIDSVSFGLDGAATTLRATMSSADLEAIQAQLDGRPGQ